jgi:hypothetical protein
MAKSALVVTLENRALRHMSAMEKLNKRIDSLYNRVVKCTCPEKRNEHMLKAMELRKDLNLAKFNYDVVMTELYGTAHKRVS